ncbi:DUF6233 domain-containing protein [Streptomyces adustus]|uniref:DUF6233 domain-containing protein n=1 Tax=Streptomyces adustus TaxID=1609272 RepID=UPI001EE40E81|nr:DUF6233 domain-containing protein [Streptomyces adustus]
MSRGTRTAISRGIAPLTGSALFPRQTSRPSLDSALRRGDHRGGGGQGLIRGNAVAVRQGRCWDAGKRRRPVTRDQAVEALRQQVPACTHCRPDTALGILE